LEKSQNEYNTTGLQQKHSPTYCTIGGCSRTSLQNHISIGDVVGFTIFVCLNIICLFIFQFKGFATTLPGFSQNVGSLIGANSVFVIVCATRHSILVFFLGIPFDRAIMVHRWLGRYTFILVMLHFVLALINWGMTANDFTTPFERMIEQGQPINYLFGLLGSISLVIICVSSLEWLRRSKVEIFFISHTMFVAFFLLSAIHHENFQHFAIIAFVFFFVWI